MSTRTGPQKYPLASTSHWYQTRYPGDAMETNTIVWHSTEGLSLPDYSSGAVAPNFTAAPDFTNKKIKWFQHFDFDTSARALVNASGGVQTNTLNVAQVEVVGTCDKKQATAWSLGGKTFKAGVDYLYMGDLPSWVIRDLAAFAKWAHEQHGVPLSSGLTFKPYSDSYGASNGVRMTNAQWTNFSGHAGHQHVPENVHGDPGAFPMAAILTAAKGGTTPEEEDMGLTDAQVKQLAEIHAATTGIGSLTEKDANGKPVPHGIGYYGAHTHRHGLMILAAETAQTAAITKLASMVGSGVDTEAVVTAVQAAIADAVVKVNVDVTSDASA